MLKKYPHVLQRVSKHFFCENVYFDDSTDQPKPRWRFRNSFEKDLASAHMTYDDDSYNKKINSVKTDLRNTNLQRRQINMSAAADVLEAIEDPFDCIFGSSTSVQDIHHPDTFSSPPRRRNYSQKDLSVGIKCVTRRTWIFELSSIDQGALTNSPCMYMKLLRKVELCGRLSVLLLSRSLIRGVLHHS